MYKIKHALYLWLRFWRGPLRDRVAHWIFPFTSKKNKPYFEGWVLSQTGLWFYVHTKSYIEYKIWIHGAYEPEITAAIISFLKPEGVFIDVGANIGTHTLPVAKYLSENGKVFAFEPIAHLRAKLEANIQWNGLQNITVVPFALAEVTRELSTAFDTIVANQGSFSLAHVSPGGTETIRCITGDAYFEPLELDKTVVIKIDVEGFEWQVCAGMQNLIRRYNPVIILEYDSNYIKRASKNAYDFETLYFNTFNYQIFIYKNYQLMPVTALGSLYEGMYTLIALPKSTA